jgi:hypothetical protein
VKVCSGHVRTCTSSEPSKSGKHSIGGAVQYSRLVPSDGWPAELAPFAPGGARQASNCRAPVA